MSCGVQRGGRRRVLAIHATRTAAEARLAQLGHVGTLPAIPNGRSRAIRLEGGREPARDERIPGQVPRRVREERNSASSMVSEPSNDCASIAPSTTARHRTSCRRSAPASSMAAAEHR
jgi:hypothetical protein